MNRELPGVVVLRMAPLVFLAASGCLSVLNAGNQDDGGQRSSAASSGTSTGARAATSAGPGSSSGAGISGGVSATASGGTTSAGGIGGTGTGSGAGGTTGGTNGGTTGCTAFGGNCQSSSECCTGSCDEVCSQGVGQPCLSGNDCTSGTCTNEICACAVQNAQLQARCGDDSDCCNGVGCNLTYTGGVQSGYCCNVTGGSCSDYYDCCDYNCVNGQCLCMPVGGERCQSDADCCTGKCITGTLFNTCINLPGDPCTQPADCTTENCDNQVCGACGSDQGLCDSSSDCCSGLVCAETLSLDGLQEVAANDAGLACCGPSGATCNTADPYGGALECCSQVCDSGGCVCVKTTDECFNDQSCCSGGACMTRASSGSGALACCQVSGQFCVSGYECCSGNCENDSCACVAAGGNCGEPGSWSALGPAACCSGVCGDGGVCG